MCTVWRLLRLSYTSLIHVCPSYISMTLFLTMYKNTLGAFLASILEEGPGTSQAQGKFLFRINSERLSEQTQCLWINNTVSAEEAVARSYSQMRTQPQRRESLGMNKKVLFASPAWLKHFIWLPAGKELFQSGAAKGMRRKTCMKAEDQHGQAVSCCAGHAAWTMAAPSCTKANPCPLHQSAEW